MEQLQLQLNEILEKYQGSYQNIKDNNGGFVAMKNNAENFDKFLNEFVDEIIEKSNNFLFLGKENVIEQAKKTIIKFNFINTELL